MDETNEDSWLYGTSNPDSTTNDPQGEEKNQTETLSTLKTEVENEAQALDAVQNASSSEVLTEVKEEIVQDDTAEFEDPAHEMEEDENAAIADTTDGEPVGVGLNAEGDDAGIGEEEKQQQKQQQSKGSAGSDDDDDEDDSDDDINVVIGDIKSGSSTYNIKQRGNLLAAGQTVGGEKSKGAAQGGKFTIEDFDGVGSINGVAAHEFSIDSLEDKPWRKPGADITDYFNYGFNEETWRAYCERQKRFRVVESGVGLASLTQNLNQSMERHGEHGSGLLPPPGTNAGQSNEQMHGSSQGMMPPPMNIHHHGSLQRISIGTRPPRPINTTSSSGNQAKENAIQVMTAECREYSRPGQIASNFGGPPPNDEPFFPEPDPFDYGYEPTQESQWGNNDNPGWVPTGIKELTPGPTLVQPPSMAGPPGVPPQQMSGPPQIRGPPPQMMGGMGGGNMPMGPPPPHVMGPMMMGPGGPGGPMRMPMGPMGMMPPQQHVGPPQVQVKIEPMEERQQRSPNRRVRSRSPHRSRRRSKSPSRQRRSRSRSKTHKTARLRRSRSSSKARKISTSTRTARRTRSRSNSKTRKIPRTHRSRSRSKETKPHVKRSRRSHTRSRSKSPKVASATPTPSTSSSSSSKKRSEKTEK